MSVKRVVRRSAGILLRLVFPKFKRKNPAEVSIPSKPTINLATTWGIHCGIATYSADLTSQLKKHANINVIKIIPDHVISPYFFILGRRTGRSGDIVHVQLEFSTFGDLKIFHKRLSSFTALLFYLGLAAGNRPVITTMHEVKPKMRLGGAAGRIYSKALNQIVCSVSDLVIVHNQESRKSLLKNSRIKPERAIVVPHGSTENPRLLDKEECKAKLGLTGKLVITIPGFVAKHKGHMLMLSILPMLEKDVHLVVAGGPHVSEDEYYLAELKALAKESGCLNRISFLGYVDDFAVVLNASDLAVLPYKTITDSGVLRLLVSYRIPTVVSDLPAFREVYEKYGSVELFKESDSADLLQKVSLVMSSPERRQLLQQNCQRMWSETRWSAIAKRHMELFMGLLVGHPDTLYDDPLQRERIDWLKHNIGGQALEVGCAGGYVTNYVNAAVGLDINNARLRYAKTKYPGKDFVNASALQMPFVDKAFDSILIPEILEHVPYEQACAIAKEATRVGKNVLITVPNAGKPNYDKAIVENPEHLWFPTEELVLKMISTCKFSYTKGEDFLLASCATT